MARYFYVFRGSSLKIWGLTVSERLSRILREKALYLEDPASLDPKDEVLLFRGDYILDDRLVKYLLNQKNLVLGIQKEGRFLPLAAHIPGELFSATLAFFKGEAQAPSGLSIKNLDEIRGDFFTHLKKYEPPFALELRPETQDQIEKRLFDWSYKGVTDLVTKWLWPIPARYVVKLCVKLGLKPNHITSLSFILVVLAGYLFYEGHLGWGLLVAWVMTFFDTVDGKLARVTVTSSKFGHYFDHIIDLIHQPIWYILFAYGAKRIGAYHIPYGIPELSQILVTFYVLGRLVEGAFTSLFKFTLFTWKPLDSFFRLILARRNPCLILLTLAFIFQRPDYGFLLVTLWMVLSNSFLFFRLLWAFYARRRGPLKSWLTEVERYRDHKLAIKWFTKRPLKN